MITLGFDSSAGAGMVIDLAGAYARCVADERAAVEAAAQPPFKPMLAMRYDSFEPGYAQPKLDGIRCIARATGLFTRQGRRIRTCDHIVAALEPVFTAYPDLVIDGELYAHSLKDDFNCILSLISGGARDAITDLQFHAFDTPSSTGGFADRYCELETIIAGVSAPDLFMVETIKVDTEQQYNRVHTNWVNQGYEGSVLRPGQGMYIFGRSENLLKRKARQDAEFQCVCIEPGRGAWAGVAKRVICQLPDGRRFAAGIRGNRADNRQLLNERHRMVTVEFLRLTPDGIPREPVATKFWGKERTA